MSTQEPIVETPAIETPVAEAPVVETPAPAAPSLPEARRDVIARQFKELKDRPRDPNGKFVPNNVPAPEFPKPQAPISRPPIPASFKQDLKPLWEAAPAELLNDFIRREQDYEKGVTPLKEKARIADEILNEFKPYEMLLKMEGSTPQQAVRPLLQTAAILRSGTPEQKAHSIASVMQQYGIPLEHIQSVLTGGSGLPQQTLDPQISALHQQVQQLTAYQQQQNEARAMSAIKSFAADHKHFDAVSNRMSQLLQTPQVLGITDEMSELEKLQSVYDAAIRLDPEISQKVWAEQQVKDTTNQRVNQAKNAAVSVKGSPSSGPTPKPNPNDRRELIKSLFHAQR